ncbi:hypothetical protein [Caulobacter sp. CCH9-E1]|jgi:hypothetical protein|uniref:hypothetical protein n=1 Tax=Caulobacter sp. CCH9-E1 TaxID=1768768 RepID=UPI00082E7573|nr:hypothetical protein [Caulobacter sp. CCH9-E1]
MRALLADVALLGMTGTARAEDPPPAPIPVAVKALEGCWRGAGEVMGKPVDITLAVKPAGLGTLVTVDADSRAKADPADRYAAHLILAGRGPAPKDGPATGVSGFWADSFGGDFTAVGKGEAVPGGFDITYPYPDAAFVNRWRLDGGKLSWSIVARAGDKDAPFAAYAMTRVACPT